MEPWNPRQPAPFALCPCPHDSPLLCSATAGLINILVGWVFLRPNLTDKVHGYLLSRGSRTSSAAAIAGLLGGRDAAQVQKIAQKKFRAISLELVTEADMAGNKPDPSLAEKTVPA